MVHKDDVLELPEELKVKTTELAIDVIFIEDQGFFHTLDRKVQGECLIPLGTL